MISSPYRRSISFRVWQRTWPPACKPKATFKFLNWLLVHHQMPVPVLENIQGLALYPDTWLAEAQAPIWHSPKMPVHGM
jgi:hypothetical protein